MLLIAFATIADVLSRALFSRAITGMEEVAGMALAVAVAACLPAGAAQRVNIAVDLLSGRISARAQARLGRLGAPPPPPPVPPAPPRRGPGPPPPRARR